MIIKSIKIENFLSISKVALNFTNEIVELIGKNNDVLVDGLPSSNGSGKSSILLALQQGLYNKNYKVTSINNVSNNISQKPYRIEVNLIGSDNKEYTIVNNRATMELIVKCKDEILSTRIKDSLPIIEDIIGLSYQEFLLLTYINTSTTSDIFVATDSNLILKFFNLSKLSIYLENLKLTRRDLTKELKRLQMMRAEHNKSSLIKDKEILELKYNSLKEDRKVFELSHEYTQNKLRLAEEAEGIREKIRSFESIKQGLENNANLMDLGICPTCNQTIHIKDSKGNTERLEKVTSDIDALKVELKEREEYFRNLRNSYEIEIGKMDSTILQYEAKLLSFKHIEDRGTSDIEKVNLNILEAEHKLNVLKSSITTIESGKVHQAYLHTFLISLNEKIKDTLLSIGLTTSITASISKGSIVYTLIDEIEKDISMLSSGESSLYALVIMVALFYTLKEQLDLEINILFLDEAIGNIDTKVIKKIEELLLTLKDKSIIVTQHHKELNDSIFDKSIVVEKTNGLSTLEEL